MSNFKDKDKDKDRLLESGLKALTLNYLIDKNMINEGDAISNEYALRSSARRADLVVSKGKELWAFEIKSEADSLTRLNGQVTTYLEHFDKVVVVAASKHIANIRDEVPHEVAIWEVRNSKVVIVQRGKKRLVANANSLTSLIRLPKLRSLMSRYDCSIKSTKRKDIEEQVAKVVPLKILRETVLSEFKSKYGQTSNFFFNSTQNQTVVPEHLSELSLYKVQEQTYVDHKRELVKMFGVFDKLKSELRYGSSQCAFDDRYCLASGMD